MEKRAQITVFIILGILVVLAAGLALYLTRPTLTRPELQLEAQRIQQEYRHCLEEKALDTLQLMGAEGGQALIAYSADRMEFPVADWYTRGKLQVPKLSDLESVLEDQAKQDAVQCLKEVKTDWTVKTREPSVDVAILEDQVVTKVSSPGRFATAGFSYSVQEEGIQTGVRLGHLYDIASIIAKDLVKNNGNPDLFLLGDFDVRVKVIPKKGYRYVQIYDFIGGIRGQPYVFSFGAVTE